MKRLVILLVVLFGQCCYGQDPLGDWRARRWERESIRNPYGAGSPYKRDGLMNPYSKYGSPFSNRSWSNPYATRPPQLWSKGRFYGELSVSPYRKNSVSNPYGKYGSPYSPYSVRNPYGVGNPYKVRPRMWVFPGR